MNFEVNLRERLARHGQEHLLRFWGELDEGGRARLELTRLDGQDVAVAFAPGAVDYDGKLPVRVFAALCAGKPVVNAADAENGARVTEALDALYRSARSGHLERVGGIA